jgi:predicted dehydrogenase
MKIGVIGLALSHPYTFAKGFAKRDAHVTAAWDDDAQTAREFVAEFGGEAVGTPKEVAQSDVDAVIVTSRAVDHAAHARLALEAGTPVFVTKPLSLDADDAATLVALSERRGTVLMSCSWIRYEPAYRALTTRLRDEALGEVVYARAVACHKIRSYIDTNDWQDDPALGGGTLINMGIHAVEPLVALMAAAGRTPEWVRCTAARTIYQDTRSEDIASLQVGFSGDLVKAV